jgi:hypothetical protein
VQMLHTNDPHFLIHICPVTQLLLAVISILLRFRMSFTFNYLSSCDDHGGNNVQFLLQSAEDTFHCVEKCAKHLSYLRKRFYRDR